MQGLKLTLKSQCCFNKLQKLSQSRLATIEQNNKIECYKHIKCKIGIHLTDNIDNYAENYILMNETEGKGNSTHDWGLKELLLLKCPHLKLTYAVKQALSNL